jgi:hypothetical protein
MSPNKQVNFQVKKRENSFSSVKFLFWKLESYINCAIWMSWNPVCEDFSPLRDNSFSLLQIYRRSKQPALPERLYKLV